MQRSANGHGTHTPGHRSPAADPQDRTGLGAALARLTDGFSRLVADHLALAQAELRADARAFGQEVVKVAAFAPLLLVGYLFLCAALSAALALVMPVWAALLLVGGLNVAAGAVGTAMALKKLQSRPPVLGESRAQAQRTAQQLAHAAKEPVPVGVMLAVQADAEREKTLGA